jgi:WD40-like Beta Propeller Repeat
VKRRAAVSIAELLADGVPVHPAEAVAVVRRLCLSADDHPPRVSHPTEIVLLADGELLTGTGRRRRQPATAILATLLHFLLDRAPLGHRAPPALDEVIARSLRLQDAEGFESVRAFAEALQQFEGPDPKMELRALFARWRAVCDLGNDLPDATQTVQPVLLDVAGTRRSVIVRKPDRRRYERVALGAANAPQAVLRASAGPTSGSGVLAPRAAEIRRAIARAHETLACAPEHRGMRDLALASALVLTVVPAGWWLAGSFAARPAPEPVEPDATAAHAAVRELDPTVPPEASFTVRPGLISTREPDFRLTGPPAAAPVSTAVSTAASPAVGPDFSRATKRSTPPRRIVRPIPSAFWFPDGKRIGYNRGRVLEIVDVKSGRSRAFSTPRRSRIGMVVVSPDGRRVVFNAGREGAWLLDLSKGDRKQMRRLVADPSVRSFVWSPDGKRVAYYSRRKGDWLVIQR